MRAFLILLVGAALFGSEVSAQSLNSVFKAQGQDQIFGFGEGILFREDTVTTDGSTGNVIRYFPNGKVYEDASYSNIKERKLHGKCTRWFENGQVQISEEYAENKRHGVLSTYYPDGKLRRREQYQNGASVKSECFSADGKLTPCTDYVLFPEYPGGVNKLMKELQSAITYPRKQIRKNVTGQVFVRFIIDKSGMIKAPSITKSLDPVLDAAAVRAVTSLRSWTPGRLDGELTETLFTLPVTFTIQ